MQQVASFGTHAREGAPKDGDFALRLHQAGGDFFLEEWHSKGDCFTKAVSPDQAAQWHRTIRVMHGTTLAPFPKVAAA